MTRIDDVNHFSKKRLVLHSFMGGISWGVGSAVGATIIFILFGIIVSRINLVPIIGNFITQVNSYVEQQQLSSPIQLPE